MWAASMSSQKSQSVQKGPVQHEFNVDVSGDSRVQWSDETQQLLYVLATWEDPEIIPPDLIGISLNVSSCRKIIQLFHSGTPGTGKRDSSTFLVIC
ncbi:hypothetical protein TNCV_2964671 [Trichonephila clavipes]|nr:hypothetical protein TNCV_2964671 [Trichonephila clavipes]